MANKIYSSTNYRACGLMRNAFFGNNLPKVTIFLEILRLKLPTPVKIRFFYSPHGMFLWDFWD
ncbi:MAG: hypothetical protein LBG47_08465 [Prevotellaceae bacterium]|jgi:hypothetical protein|nr:hypothetical protein [Prevotellaceae bacterium]